MQSRRFTFQSISEFSSLNETRACHKNLPCLREAVVDSRLQRLGKDGRRAGAHLPGVHQCPPARALPFRTCTPAGAFIHRFGPSPSASCASSGVKSSSPRSIGIENGPVKRLPRTTSPDPLPMIATFQQPSLAEQPRRQLAVTPRTAPPLQPFAIETDLQDFTGRPAEPAAYDHK